MSAYFTRGRGWRFDFVHGGKRYTSGHFKTKSEAKQAEARRKEELSRAGEESSLQAIPTDTVFLELVNRRLDHVKAYNSARHYEEYVYMARRWAKKWGQLRCVHIRPDMIEKHVLERSRVSAYTANKELRYLRTTFNFGLKKHLIINNPTQGMEFLPVEKRVKYVPPMDDIAKIIAAADPEAQDYLCTVRDTMGRISEINRLAWDDVDFGARTVTMYTRKKRGGHLTPRVIPMTQQLFEILSRRYRLRDESKPWVFWHRYWSHKNGCWVEGPYRTRHHLLRNLCALAGVRPFGFHGLRHAGASLLDSQGVPIGVIQRVLGHENRTTTEIYLHSTGDAERAAMAVFDRANQHSQAESHADSHANSHAKRRKEPRLRLVKG